MLFVLPHLAKMNLTNQSIWFPRGAELCVSQTVFEELSIQWWLGEESSKLKMLWLYSRASFLLKARNQVFHQPILMDGWAACLFTPRTSREAADVDYFRRCLACIQSLPPSHQQKKPKSSPNYLWPKHKNFNCLPGNKICRQASIRELSHATSY